MHMTDLIEKKKQGQTLTQEELHFIVHGYTAGDIPDYQMSALMMAIYFRGMTPEETAQLTIEMEHSGDVVDLSPLGEHTADKHSTGGVGDKTSLVLCPMVAACGGKMAKMSGRGLGHTGGTIDKLESFPGFSTAMTPEKFLENAENVGFVIAGQTANLAPADKKNVRAARRDRDGGLHPADRFEHHGQEARLRRAHHRAGREDRLRRVHGNGGIRL